MNEAKLTRELKEIIYYIKKYGKDRIGQDLQTVLGDESLRIDFYTQVHKGFYYAQERALTLLTKILKERKRLKRELVSARTAKDKQKQSQLTTAIEMSKYHESVVRKTMDSLVWVIFNGQASSVRRLYCFEEPIDITDSNLESEIDYIEKYKASHPEGFALICDLTSVAQIGDIITISPTDGIDVVELKDGHVNKQVFELISEASKNPCPEYLPNALQDKNPKFIKHVHRTIKQIQKDNNAIKTINTGHGKEPKTGMGVHITEGDLIENDYSVAMRELSLNCNKSGYSITTIQNCLHVGVYDTTKFPSEMFDIWMRSINTKTYTYDLRRSFTEPLAYPAFLHPFSETFIIDIINGKKVVKIALNFDEWFNMLETFGCTPKWMSKKQTARDKAKINIPGVWIEVDGQGIEIEKDGTMLQLSTGICSRIFSKFLTPLSACELIVELLQNPPPDE